MDFTSILSQVLTNFSMFGGCWCIGNDVACSVVPGAALWMAARSLPCCLFNHCKSSSRLNCYVVCNGDCYRIVIYMPGLKKKPAISQVVFIGMCLLAPVWGFIGDKYGRQTVSAIIYWNKHLLILHTSLPINRN